MLFIPWFPNSILKVVIFGLFLTVANIFYTIHFNAPVTHDIYACNIAIKRYCVILIIFTHRFSRAKVSFLNRISKVCLVILRVYLGLPLIPVPKICQIFWLSFFYHNIVSENVVCEEGLRDCIYLVSDKHLILSFAGKLEKMLLN